MHIDSSGVQVPLCESKYAWQPIGGPNIELAPGRAANLSLTLKTDITMPLESSVALNQLLESMKGVFKHNFVAGRHDNEYGTINLSPKGCSPLQQA